VDRFNLQIQIASLELKLQKLEETKSSLEVQIAHELAQLAALRMQLGRRGAAAMPPSTTPVRREMPQPTPAEVYEELVAHLADRGYHKTWTRHVVVDGNTRIEQWRKNTIEAVMVFVTLEGDAIVNCQLFVSSLMCPEDPIP
jgi:hypothetical protein